MDLFLKLRFTKGGVQLWIKMDVSEFEAIVLYSREIIKLENRPFSVYETGFYFRKNPAHMCITYKNSLTGRKVSVHMFVEVHHLLSKNVKSNVKVREQAFAVWSQRNKTILSGI